MTVIGVTLAMVFAIPLVALLVDSHIGRAVARRIEPRQNDVQLRRDVDALIERVELLQAGMDELREENDFLRRLLQRNDGTQ